MTPTMRDTRFILVRSASIAGLVGLNAGAIGAMLAFGMPAIAVVATGLIAAALGAMIGSRTRRPWLGLALAIPACCFLFVGLSMSIFGRLWAACFGP